MTSNMPAIAFESALQSVDSWLNEYITKIHPEIGRTGPICPFVEPARKNRSLEVRVRLTGNSPTLELIEEIATSSLREYKLTSWQGRNPMLHAMIVILPDIEKSSTELLDRAQSHVKDEFVSHGLMIGQFHENCDVKAARNPEFNVSRAPVSLFAIRAIAIHDIFFLSDRRHWFDSYRERFGRFYETQATGIDTVWAERYRLASQLYGYDL